MITLSTLISKARSMVLRSTTFESYADLDNVGQNDILLGGKRVSNIRFLGRSKMDNLSWTGYLDKRPVKFYQVVSLAHAQYIESVCNEPDLREYFPEVLYVHDNYMIVEWIQGTCLHGRTLRKEPKWLLEIARMQAKFHSCDLFAESQSFDYITLLKKRFLYYLGPFAHN